MNTGTRSGTLPIEIRRSTVQLVRLELGQHAWFVPTWALIFLPTGFFQSTWPSPWLVALLIGLLFLTVALDVSRRRKEVVRLTETGLYAGRDDGKKLGWLAPKPIELRWGEIRGFRLTGNRWSNKILVDTTGYTQVLPLPVSTWFNPDRELHDRVDLIRRTWEAERGPLPPPPAPPWFLPTDHAPEPRPG